jgi:inorganic pyrophosphatase
MLVGPRIESVTESKSLKLAKEFLGKVTKVTIDRPLGSNHPKWGFRYPVNYGFIEGVIAPDGANLDAYLLRVDRPVGEYEGVAVAIIHRIDDDDDKLVVVPKGEPIISDGDIESAVEFQEKWFVHTIVRG